MVRSVWASALGVLLTLAPPAVLAAGLGVPTIRDHPYALLSVSAAGALMTISPAVARRTKGTVLLSALAFALAGLFGFTVTVLIAVPRTGSVPAAGDPAPDFTLRDVSGAEVNLASQAAQGARLVVFFRGAW